jgi:hypothetical protein
MFDGLGWGQERGGVCASWWCGNCQMAQRLEYQYTLPSLIDLRE